MKDGKPAAPELPAWAATLRQRYVSGASSLFVVHGNVHDLVPWDGGYVPLREFLGALFSRTKEIVAFYDVASGLRFAKKEMEGPFRLALGARRLLEAAEALPDTLPREAPRLFPFLDSFLRDPSQHGAFVVEYAETVVPAGETSFLGEAERALRVTVQRWSTDPSVLASDNLIVLVCENVSDLDRTVRSAPRVMQVEVPLPDAGERLAFVQWLVKQQGRLGMAEGRIADGTAGLTRVQIDVLCREARAEDEKMSPERIAQIKRQLIEQECFGLVEFVESPHDFSVVGGLEELKRALRRVVDAIRKGERARVPMGVLLVGPMGTGKSFLMEAFANECGMTTLKLKNFRDKWVGSTEGNLEKILHVVQALGNTLVVIDEGDRSIGGQGRGDQDGGVDSRVIARLKEFMSDTRHRGSILFAMLTNRPDKLDADMKRPGRFDLKLPFFPPQDEVERSAVIKALLKKNKILHKIEDLRGFGGRVAGMTGAEIEAVLLSALNFARDRGAAELHEEDLGAALLDYIPSRDDAMMRYMELLAVFEASSRRMLPEKYRALSVEELNRELRAQQGRLLRG
jgi:AAA+ superfamily predicted ATPase